MHESMYRLLAPVRRRQQVSFALRLLVYGLLIGSLGGLLLGLLGWRMGWPAATWLSVALGLGPVLALLSALAGLVWQRSWRGAAVAVDTHYGLKDRSATALDFLARPDAGAMHRLQIADAVEHLRSIDPCQVVPLRGARPWPYAVGAWVVTGVAMLLVLLLWTQVPTVAAGPTPPQPHIVAEAERNKEGLQELEEAARQDENKELQQLVEKLQQKIDERKEADIDDRENLAKISEMEAAIHALQAQYNSAIIDGQLQSLGSAMSGATALEGAGKALQEAKLEKAAQELEKLEDPQLDRKQAKAVEEKLAQVAKEMSDVGLGSLSAAVSDFAEGLKGGKGKGQKATKVLAKEVRNQARRKRINDLLNAYLDQLTESKCNCEKNSLVKGKRPEKSMSPSSTFGAGTSGNVQGEKTNLLSQRNQVDLTGTPGDGPSDIETTSSPEARQQAQRGYREVYQKYRKMSEAVLDSEPIPLGHRQTIRRYFELIRPQNEDKMEK